MPTPCHPQTPKMNERASFGKIKKLLMLEFLIFWHVDLCGLSPCILHVWWHFEVKTHLVVLAHFLSVKMVMKMEYECSVIVP